MNYRPDIDGLRAIAILLVVAFHVGLPGMQAGFIGVDVFFVISGYLITALLVRELTTSGQINLAEFYSRRVRRLAPAIFLVLTCLVGLSLYFLHPFGQQQDMAKSAMASALFVANFYFAHTTGGYFDTPDSEVYLLHFWSLAVEEQFYLLWPLALVLLAVLASSRNYRLTPVLLGGTAVIALGSLALCLYLSSVSTAWAYFLMPARMWQLLSGALLALILLRRNAETIPRVWINSLYLAGIVSLLLGLRAIEGPQSYPSVLAVLPTIGAVFLIAGGGGSRPHPVRAALSSPPVVYIGKLSFSWYLWHWPLIAMARSYDLGTDNPARDHGMAILSLGLAAATYRFVERPFRRRPTARRWPAKRVIMVGGAAVVSLVLSAGLVGLAARHAVAVQPWWKIDNRLLTARFTRGPLRRQCHQELPFTRLSDQTSCTVGAQEQAIRLVLWGDSHADHLSPLIAAFADQENVAALQRSFSSCHPVLGLYDHLREDVASACRSFHQSVLQELRSLKREGLQGVVMSAYWYGARTNVLARPTGAEILKSHLMETASTINALGLKLLIVEPLPALPFSPLGCLARRSEEAACRLSRADWENRSSMVRKVVRNAAVPDGEVRLLDLTDTLCDEWHCYAARDGMILYRDKHHVTPTAARAMLSPAMDALRWVSGAEIGAQLIPLISRDPQ